jgi:hypothetical protein
MSDLYLANKNEVPQGGFRFYQSETNYTITGPSWQDLIINVKKHRIANNIPIGLNFDRDVEQQLADNLPESQITKDNPNRSAAMPRDEWPSWVNAIAAMKNDSDKGVGDTIQRVVGPVGGDSFKRWFQTIFHKSCGCTERQEAFNNQYPY